MQKKKRIFGKFLNQIGDKVGLSCETDHNIYPIYVMEKFYREM
jgi:hypothetical protein